MKQILFFMIISLFGLNLNSQYFQDFENGIPSSWGIFNHDTISINHKWQSAFVGYNSGKSASISYTSAGSTNDWLISEGITVSSGDSLYFRIIQSFSTDYLSVLNIKISTTSPTDTTTFTQIATLNETDYSSSSWDLKNYSLSAYVGQTIYVAFQFLQNNGDNCYIDNVSVGNSAPKPSCVNTVSNVTLSNITTNSINYVVSGLDSNVVDLQLINFNDITDTLTFLNKDTMGTLNGLSPNKFYNVFSRRKCNSLFLTTSSNYSFNNNFPTLCSSNTASVSLPFEDDFEDGVRYAFDCDWKVINVDSSSKGFKITINPGDKAYGVFYNSTIAKDDWIISPSFNATANTTYYINFDGQASSTWKESFEVKAGMGNSATDMTNLLHSNSNFGSGVAETIYTTFTPTTSGQYNIGIHVNSVMDKDYFFVNNFMISATPPCKKIDTLMLSNITTNSITYSWNSSDVPVTGYYVQYNNYDPNVAFYQESFTTDTFFTLNNLVPDNLLFLQVSTVCTPDTLSPVGIYGITNCDNYSNNQIGDTLFYDNFEQEAAGSSEFCDWVVENSNPSSRSWFVNGVIQDNPSIILDNGAAQISFDASYEKDDWLISPSFTMNSGDKAILYYTANANKNFPESFEVYVMNSQNSTASNKLLIDSQVDFGSSSFSSTSDTVVFDELVSDTFTASFTGDHFIGFYANTVEDMDFITIDNVYVKLIKKSSINDNNLDNISIYPNPTNSIFKLNLSDYVNSTMVIYNSIGKKVYEKNNLNGVVDVNINLSAGVYNIQVENNGRISNQKLIVSK